MIVVCEDCGAKYQIDTSKIKGEKAIAKCKFCGHQILVNKPEPGHEHSEPHRPFAPDEEPLSPTASMNMHSYPQGNSTANSTAADKGANTSLEDMPVEYKTGARRIFGLRVKMLLLFFVLPIILIAGASFLYMQQMKGLAQKISSESTDVVTEMAENIIVQKAQAVSRQVGMYLNEHPQLKPEDLHSDPQFTEIAIQKIGKTGYTLIDEGPHGSQGWINRAHFYNEIVGKDVLEVAKKVMDPKHFEEFKAQHDQAAKREGVTSGYFQSLDGNGRKFEVLVPIPKTNLFVTTTNDLAELTEPMLELNQHTYLKTNSIMKYTLLILIIAIILVAMVVIIYSTRLSANIKSLTEVTNRISVGDVNIEVKTPSNDELGDLAEAVARMQTSIRISLDRFRKRRKRKRRR